MEDIELRKRLLKNATLEELQKSDDSIIKLALKLSAMLEDIKECEKRLSGALVLLRPLYFEALSGYKSGNIAPDFIIDAVSPVSYLLQEIVSTIPAFLTGLLIRAFRLRVIFTKSPRPKYFVCPC